jgi:hypothetical protein
MKLDRIHLCKQTLFFLVSFNFSFTPDSARFYICNRILRFLLCSLMTSLNSIRRRPSIPKHFVTGPLACILSGFAPKAFEKGHS